MPASLSHTHNPVSTGSSFDTDTDAAGRLAVQLRQALTRGEVEVHYQPLIDLRDGTTVRLEALARWPAGGPLVGPDQFVRAAERAGWVAEFDLAVFEITVRQLAIWSVAGAQPLVSVNFSTLTMACEPAIERAIEIVRERFVSPTALVVEVTETACADPMVVARSIEKLRGVGIRVALDDFGSRCSLLDQLCASHTDELKIDKSFIAGLDRPRVRVVVTAMIELAHALGMEVVAEGIENDDQLRQVIALACDTAQGYLFSAAVGPHEAFVRLDERYDVSERRSRSDH